MIFTRSHTARLRALYAPVTPPFKIFAITGTPDTPTPPSQKGETPSPDEFPGNTIPGSGPEAFVRYNRAYTAKALDPFRIEKKTAAKSRKHATSERGGIGSLNYAKDPKTSPKFSTQARAFK
ncbi:hypothetical protein RUND412_007919 [Rhizina undulata]